MAEGLNLKFHCMIDMINHEIDGDCHGYLSRFYGEWYYNITINFNYSNFHMYITISEETMRTQSTQELLHMIIDRIKADILSNYFK